MEKIIAYDLDGVFVSDTDWREGTLKLRKIMKPLFIPEHDFVIITGRPVEDGREELVKWAHDNFGPKLKKIYCSNTDWKRAAEYKAKILQSHPEITLFIESKDLQVDLISTLVKTPVIHFEKFIKQSLAPLERRYLNED